MITIVHAIDSMGLGGAQTLLYELYYAIKTYHVNYKQVIFLLDRREFKERIASSYQIPYITIRREKLYSNISKLKNPLLLYHKLMISDTSVYKKIRKEKKIPIITINHSFSLNRRYNQIYDCNALVSVCEKMKRTMYKTNPHLRHEVIHNGVNFKKYDKIKPVSINNKKNVLITGRINKFNMIKHPMDWIQWCMKVKLPCRMEHEYIGGGSYANMSKQLVKKNKRANFPNKVNILGEIKDFEQKVSILKSWDLFLYEINTHEGVSMSILEALASGVPVICSNHYGNKEIMEDGINGYVFKDRKHAQKILSDLCVNRDKLEKLKQTTKEHFVKKLDAKIMANKYISLIEKIYKKHKEKYNKKNER